MTKVSDDAKIGSLPSTELPRASTAGSLVADLPSYCTRCVCLHRLTQGFVALSILGLHSFLRLTNKEPCGQAGCAPRPK